MSSGDAKSPQGNVATLKERLATIKAQLSRIPEELKEEEAMKKQQQEALTAWARADEEYDLKGKISKALKLAENAKGDLSKIKNRILREYAKAHRQLVVTLPKKRKDLNVELVKTQKALGEAAARGDTAKDMSGLFNMVQMMYITMKEMKLEQKMMQKQMEQNMTKLEARICANMNKLGSQVGAKLKPLREKANVMIRELVNPVLVEKEQKKRAEAEARRKAICRGNRCPKDCPFRHTGKQYNRFGDYSAWLKTSPSLVGYSRYSDKWRSEGSRWTCCNSRHESSTHCE